MYLKYSTPVYESTAAILVKDEKKGLDESKMAQDFNLFGATNIVENEMEILGSNSIISEVVKRSQFVCDAIRTERLVVAFSIHHEPD